MFSNLINEKNKLLGIQTHISKYEFSFCSILIILFIKFLGSIVDSLFDTSLKFHYSCLLTNFEDIRLQARSLSLKKVP